MKETEAILDEIFRLVSEQAKALEGRLSEEKAVNCRLRAEPIKELLHASSEMVSGTNRLSPHPQLAAPRLA
jgi:hypothetical protein